MTAPGKAWHKYKEKIYEWIDIYTFAQMFHWTPEQVRNIEYEDKMYMKALALGAMQDEKNG